MHYHKYHLPGTIEIYLLCHNLLFFDPLKIIKIIFSMDQQTAHGPHNTCWNPLHVLFVRHCSPTVHTHCLCTTFMCTLHLVDTKLKLNRIKEEGKKRGVKERESWKGGFILTRKWISNPQLLLYIWLEKKRKEKKITYI